MASRSIADLRRLFFGGGTDVEAAALQAYDDGGYTYQDVLNVAKAYKDGTLGGGGIPPATLTTKGDLLVATAAGVVTRHAVPALADQTLIADPTTADGWGADFALDRGEAYARPAGAIAETFSRRNQLSNVTGVPVSGTLHCVAVFLPANRVITSVSFVSGGTAAVAPTNQWFALLDNGLVVLSKTVDDTTNPWALNTIKTLNLSAPFTTTYAGLHYLGIVVVATTTPSLTGFIDAANAQGAIVPAMAGSSTPGLTNPASLGANANAISGSQSRKPWAWVS